MTSATTPLITAPTTASHSGGLASTLQQARKARGLSQLELSLRLGVSQRHISFVECTRAKPSRVLLLAWLQALEVPLALRNAALLQSGYAPAFSAAPLTDPALAQAKQAVEHLLRAHDPMPSFALDALWNMVHINQGARWLISTLIPDLANPFNGTPDGLSANGIRQASGNLLDLLVAPQGLAQHIINLHEVGAAMLSHLRTEASVLPALQPRVDAFATLLQQRLGGQDSSWLVQPTLDAHLEQHPSPLLTTRLASGHGELAFFSMFTTFGSPHDITLASLRVEHMFAANEATASVLHTAARTWPSPQP